MEEEYQLINPFILGKIKTNVKSKSPINAAKKIWDTLSNDVLGYVPKFLFSIKNMKGGRVYHFSAKELPNDTDTTDYEIKEIEGQLNEQIHINRIKQHIKEFKRMQLGGRKHRHHDIDDSSSSSSDSDIDRHLIKALKHRRSTPLPISYLDYFPPVFVNDKSVYVPTFNITSPTLLIDPPFTSVYYGTDVIRLSPRSATEEAIHDTIKTYRDLIGLSPLGIIPPVMLEIEYT